MVFDPAESVDKGGCVETKLEENKTVKTLKQLIVCHKVSSVYWHN